LILNGAFLSSAPSGKQYDNIIRQMARKYEVDAELIHSIIRAESNYDSQAVSPKGAVGLMQLMPSTAKDYGVEDPYDPVENIEGGVRLLKDLLKTYEKEEDLVLAAYNAGPDAVKKHKGIPPYPETLRYIQKVKSFRNTEKLPSSRQIYSFRDKTGRLIITNDHNFYLRNKK